MGFMYLVPGMMQCKSQRKNGCSQACSLAQYQVLSRPFIEAVVNGMCFHINRTVYQIM